MSKYIIRNVIKDDKGQVIYIREQTVNEPSDKLENAIRRHGNYIAKMMKANKERRTYTIEIKPALTDSIWQEFARKGCLVNAIKTYRELHKCGLKEAKDLVEEWIDNERRQRLLSGG